MATIPRNYWHRFVSLIMKNLIKFLISLSVSFISIYFATKNVHWNELKKILSNAEYSPLLLAVFISAATFWLRAARWQILLEPFQKIKALTLLRWQIGGLLINNLLPLRMGEIARAYWAGHKSAISKSAVMATIVVERVLDISSIAVLGMVILFVTGFYRCNFSCLTFKNSLLFLILISTLVMICRFYSQRLTAQALMNKARAVLSEKLFSMMEKFITGLKILKDKREVIKVFSLSLVIWSIDIGALAVISRTLNLNLTWIKSGLVTIGLILGVMVPAAPGAAGTYEAGGVAALSLIGVEKTLALSFILLLHTFQYLYVLMIGIPVLIMEGFHPKQFMKSMKSSG